MKRIALLLLASTAIARPLPTIRSADFVPNPAFGPLRFSAADDGAMGAVEQIAEVVVLEGDSSLVTDDGMGGFGIVFNNGLQQPPNITNRFYTQYPDQFDEIIIFTTFDDNGAQGALAYEISAQQDVRGIGQQVFDESIGWGATSGKLHAFVNMMRWDQFHNIDGLDEADPSSSLYSTLGQEFAHRWLAFMSYKDKTGATSDAMLGRAKAHWASTLQADASVMDGDRLVDNGDGTFTDVETFARYSPLDLYGMGLMAPTDVPPWFLVKNATSLSGTPINPAVYMRLGNHFKGVREDISIEDVIAAEGARAPASDKAERDFRVAFVLVTRPGEKAGDVVAVAQKLDAIRKVWEQQFVKYTGGRGTMCTQISAPCGAPTARLVSSRFAESGGNGNGVVEPGEPVAVTFTVENDGPQPANDVSVTLTSDVLQLSAMPQTITQLNPGQSSDVTFIGTLPSNAACGQILTVRAQATTGGNTFRGFAQMTPGLQNVLSDPFATNMGLFAANLDGMDTTVNGSWQWGTPVEYHGRNGYQFQPGSGYQSPNCWFTGLQKGHRPSSPGDTSQSAVDGKTTLWSPAIDVSKTYLPTLRYFVWYQAIDFSNPSMGGTVADTVPLVVEASADGGKTWLPVDMVPSGDPTWFERRVDLASAKVPTDGTLLFRFTASVDDTRVLVEAGLSDFEIITQTPACNPNAATTPEPTPAIQQSGCSLSGSSTPSFFTLAFLTAAFALFRRRRRR